MTTGLATHRNTDELSPVSRLGELSDEVATALFSLARGDQDAAHAAVLGEMLSTLGAITDELRRPLFVGSTLTPSRARRIVLRGEGADGDARALVIAFLESLIEALNAVRADYADRDQVLALAHHFERIGEAAFSSPRTNRQPAWTTT